VGLWAGDELRWLAHTLSVFSRRITSRILCVSLCCSNRASPVPRSFHSFAAESNRKSLERLRTRGTRRSKERISHRKSIQEGIGGEGHVQLENYGLILFISLCYDLFCELDDGFKVGIMFILRLSRVTKVNCMTDGWVWQRVIYREKTRKKLTLGAKGFVLKSAMTDDGGAMRVCSRRKAWAEGVVLSRACQSIWNQSLTGHRTPPLTTRPPAFPGPSTSPLCSCV